MEVSTRVRYKASFLRSIGEYTGPMPFAKGTITEIKSFGKTSLARVTWDKDTDELPGRVNVANLEKIK